MTQRKGIPTQIVWNSENLFENRLTNYINASENKGEKTPELQPSKLDK